jgi:hypothetical protein
MELVTTGMLNKQIAGELGTAEKTVKVHRGRVMEKLGVTSVAELVLLVQRARLASVQTVRPRSNRLTGSGALRLPFRKAI